MARFKKRNFFKKQDSEIKTEEIKNFENLTEKITTKKNDSTDKPSPVKSLIKTGTKYAYIIVAAAFLSGIFTPFTLDLELNIVILGMLVIFLGLGGGILIFKATTRKEHSSILIVTGLTLMVISLIAIFQMFLNLDM